MKRDSKENQYGDGMPYIKATRKKEQKKKMKQELKIKSMK